MVIFGEHLKFKDNKEVITLVDKSNVKNGSIGIIVCVFENPEGYDAEFCNDTYYEPSFLPGVVVLNFYVTKHIIAGKMVSVKTTGKSVSVHRNSI